MADPMAETLPAEHTPPEQVALTLHIDAPVHEAFLQKAQRAGMDVETFLASTLAIVLGCRIFQEQHSCSPVHFERRPTDQP